MPKQEHGFLNSVGESFAFNASFPIDLSEQLLEGRPYGEVAFLSCKRIAASVLRIEVHDDRLICIKINIGSQTHRIVSCYLPYATNENYVYYVDYLAKIPLLMNNHPNESVIAIGDFNARP